MPVYTYKAYNDTGQVKSGIEDADSARDARLRLRRQGLHVTDIEELQTKQERGASAFAQWRARRQTKKELPQVTRQLATLLRSGIPLNEAMKALVTARSSTSSRCARVLASRTDSENSGQ